MNKYEEALNFLYENCELWNYPMDTPKDDEYYTQLENSKKSLKELIDNYSKLEKALDKACELLSKSKVNDLCLLDMYVNGSDILDKNVWKEYLLKESEKK